MRKKILTGLCAGVLSVGLALGINADESDERTDDSDLGKCVAAALMRLDARRALCDEISDLSCVSKCKRTTDRMLVDEVAACRTPRAEEDDIGE